jgi:hypothetical protein
MLRNIEIGLSNIDEIEEEIEGIYIWFLKPKNLNEEKCLKFFHAFNNFEIKLEGMSVLNNSSKFGDIFKGKILRIEKEEIEKRIENVDLNFILEFTKNNPIPLYLGKSRNLKKRIKQHYDGYLDKKNIPSNVFSKFENDTDLESSFFGSRLSEFNSPIWFGENELTIGIYYDKSLSSEQITELEFFLNRFYKPILGIN